jgi:hypothetical protein
MFSVGTKQRRTVRFFHRDFRAIRDMKAGRFLHTATVLHDGRVLIAGGYASPRNVPLRTAELFDPATETFAFTGDLTEPAAETATLLAKGNVLITRSFEFGVRNKAELYDPATGTFARTADLTGPYQGVGPAATLLTTARC